MRPVDVGQLPAVARRGRRLDQVCPADLFVALGGELRDNEVAAIGVEVHAIAIADHEPGGPAGVLLSRRLRFPDALTRVSPQAPELAVAAEPVDVAVLDD